MSPHKKRRLKHFLRPLRRSSAHWVVRHPLKNAVAAQRTAASHGLLSSCVLKLCGISGCPLLGPRGSGMNPQSKLPPLSLLIWSVRSNNVFSPNIVFVLTCFSPFGAGRIGKMRVALLEHSNFGCDDARKRGFLHPVLLERLPVHERIFPCAVHPCCC